MMAQSHATMMAPQSQPRMQPQEESYREKAKIAAIVDIVIDALGIFFYFWTAWFCLNVVLINKSSTPGIGLFYLLLFMSAVAFVVHGVAIWMDVTLLNAVKPITSPNQSLMLAKRWRLYYIFFIIFIVIFGCIFFAMKEFLLNGLVTIFFGLLRLPILYIGHKFIQELQRVGGGAPVAEGNAMANTSSQYQQKPQDRKGRP